MKDIMQLGCVEHADEQPAAIRRRPHGRSARVQAAVIEATLLMLEQGEMPRIEEVARRAGVQKTSIYRRWGTLEGLIFDAVGARAAKAIPLPDTGSCEEDLRAYLAASVEFHRSDFGILVTRLGVQVPEATRREFWDKRLEAASTLLLRGRVRGEIGSTLDLRVMAEMLMAPFHFRTLVSGEEVTSGLAQEILRIVMSSAASTRGAG